MARSKPKPQTHTESMEDAVSNAFGELTGLAEEVREVCDNMPESLHNGARYETLDSTATELEGLSEPDVPESLKTLEVTYVTFSRRRMSRGARRDNAVAILDECIAQLVDIENNDDAESLASDLELIKDTAESVEFPGMYG